MRMVWRAAAAVLMVTIGYVAWSAVETGPTPVVVASRAAQPVVLGTSEPSGSVPSTTTVPPAARPPELVGEPRVPTVPGTRTIGVTVDGEPFPAADPAIERDGEVWRLFTTQDYLVNVPSWESIDGIVWQPTGDALPTLPGWAAWGQTWAPDVVEVDDGWVLYFSALVAGTDRHCIGHATADSATGPYEAADEPLVCELDEGGSIDPSVVRDDDGRLHLLWKVDANALGTGDPSRLRSQPLDATATTLTDEPVELLVYGGPGEWPLIEQPEMVVVEDVHHLFYASGWYNQPSYQVRLARCASVRGPCERVGDTGWISSETGFEGPGALSLAESGTDWIGVHHAWLDGFGAGATRSLVVEPISFDEVGPGRR